MHYKRLIALLMVCAYLILPLDSFGAHQPPVAAGLASVLLESPDQAALSNASDPGCPCSDPDRSGSHDADGCNTGCSCCSCCSFFAPLPAAISWSGPPPKDVYVTRDPIQSFPEVYLPIFVPPQNLG